MAIVRLTTLDKFKKLLGESNADEYTTPYVGDDADDYLLEFIDLASEYVAGKIPTYDPTTLTNSKLLDRITLFVAGWMLTQERDNPAHFGTGFNWAMDMLEQIRRGEITLTEATKSDDGPAVVNFRYEPLVPHAPVRIDWIATSPHSWPSDPYHGYFFGYMPLIGWLW